MELRDYLHKNYMSVSDFARKIDYARAWVSRIMSGRDRASPMISDMIEAATQGEVKAEDLHMVYNRRHNKQVSGDTQK